MEGQSLKKAHKNYIKDDSKRRKLETISNQVENIPSFENFCLRFPLASKTIFDNIDAESLIKSKAASRVLNSTINDERSYWIRIFRKYKMNFKEYSESWRTFAFKSPLEVVKKLANATICEFSKYEFLSIDCQYSPLHIAACQGDLLVYRNIMEKFDEKNPRRTIDDKTPLHMAAKNGNSDVCQLILENVQDKSPCDIYGMTPTPLCCKD